jgi:hypothetical protein
MTFRETLPLNCPIAVSKKQKRRDAWSGSNPVPFAFRHQIRRSDKKSGRYAMAGNGFRSLPRENPCAQCGKSIALPEWVEAEPGRTFYLWRCMACDYRFEAVAYFDCEEADREAIAA